MVDLNSSLSINGWSFYQSLNILNPSIIQILKKSYRRSPRRQGIHTAMGRGVTSAAR
jgi:hypothetical protein